METEPKVSRELLEQLNALCLPLKKDQDFAPLYERIGQAKLVLLGEASHGTSEYYRMRTTITRNLVEEKKFSFIAVEGDWPDCFLVNQYVKGRLDPTQSARRVLSAFRRWPSWMWANEEMIDMIEWPKLYNDHQPEKAKVGFYGLDVYSLWESLSTLTQQLKKYDPESMGMVNQVFDCFNHFQGNAHEYARATYFKETTCEKHVHGLLEHLKTRKLVFDRHAEGHLQAEQNARVLKNAEAYYRAMVRGGPMSWNIRDFHMVETLDELMKHHGELAKGIVWEHNTHIGDARFTDMFDSGEMNVGQLVRERYGDENAVLVGFSGYQGSVIAARRWEAPMQAMPCPKGREGSWEDVFHRVSRDNKLLVFSHEFASDEMLEERGHRAIGVVYHPEGEHLGNYVPTILPQRYDAVIYVDQTHALHPLHLRPLHDGEMAETYPSAM
ncbi:MAG TPA: erythromycin esterase family protein [Oligoflexus sp.]|uniref:erythromycin esterase family protein n=1 Tax=Oligoflexus sp. TaxID=1971216 RepID=UPI002D57B12F|nr:erythromycin esterase family protein [Oligoflexus sp.]HYX33610.1 erythromycin esterase family protein [Oligoflexus sp.]